MWICDSQYFSVGHFISSVIQRLILLWISIISAQSHTPTHPHPHTPITIPLSPKHRVQEPRAPTTLPPDRVQSTEYTVQQFYSAPCSSWKTQNVDRRFNPLVGILVLVQARPEVWSKWTFPWPDLIWLIDNFFLVFHPSRVHTVHTLAYEYFYTSHYVNYDYDYYYFSFSLYCTPYIDGIHVAVIMRVSLAYLFCTCTHCRVFTCTDTYVLTQNNHGYSIPIHSTP